MNREILFRGKTTDGEWREGSLVIGELKGETVVQIRPFMNIHVTYFYGTCGMEVFPETVGQFTGLTDRNGKKIFEGDIIKHHRHLWGEDVSDIGVVFWNAGTCQFRRTSSQNGETPQIWQSSAEHYEVIGNVHDNPEWLERKNNERNFV